MEKRLTPMFWNEDDLCLEKIFQKEVGVAGMCIPSVADIHAQMIECGIRRKNICVVGMGMPAVPQHAQMIDCGIIRRENHIDMVKVKQNLDTLFLEETTFPSGFFFCHEPTIKFKELNFNAPFFKEGHELVFNQSLEDFKRKEPFFKFKSKEIDENLEKLKGKKAPGGRTAKQHLNILNLNKKKKNIKCI